MAKTLRIFTAGELKSLSIKTMDYVRIKNNEELPDISKHKPFKCVVVIEQEIAPDWQVEVSNWLCSSGCMYMMAWGQDCSSWDDSVDQANIMQFQGEEIPDDSVVFTTWHEDEPLSEVFWFAKHTAHHESHDLKNTVVLHISVTEKSHQFKAEYANA